MEGHTFSPSLRPYHSILLIMNWTLIYTLAGLIIVLLGFIIAFCLWSNYRDQKRINEIDKSNNFNTKP